MYEIVILTVRPMDTRILLVDDDALLRTSLSFSLQQVGFGVSAAATAQEAWRQVSLQPPALVLLDIGLPDGDGRELCARLQTSFPSLPIIFLTARAQEIDTVLGLQLGADDYVVRPISAAEIVARNHAVLRRGQRASGRSSAALQVGPLRLDPLTHEAWFEQKPLKLAPKAFHLLYTLARRGGQVVTTSELLDTIWGPGYQGEPQTLYVHVRQLREQIEMDPRHPRLLLTVHSVGYKLDAEGRGHV